MEVTSAYVFDIVLEPDVDADGNPDGWHVFCPSLKAASTWGATQEEALQHIREVILMTVEGMLERGEPLPIPPIPHTQPLNAQVLITI